jgi:hypothetical protein
MIDEYEDHVFEDEGPSRLRDSKIDEAKEILLSRIFPEGGTDVYYGRQLEFWLERKFYHWITKKALNELAQERKINFQAEKSGYLLAHFYYPRRHRYPRRQINEMVGLIAEFSEPAFTRVLGHYGELLADAGFARIGFRILQNKVTGVDGKRWSKTNHDLDRLIQRDGVRWGVEIKNQVGYIQREEFQAKVEMCRYFGVRPMSVARMMPKSYINEVRLAGGSCLILANQHYPIMAEDLARRVRERLKLPVINISTLPDTTIKGSRGGTNGQFRQVP